MAAQAKQQEPKSSLFASPQRARGLFPVAVELMIWKKKLGWQSTVVAGDLNLGERGHFFLCLKASSIEYCSPKQKFKFVCKIGHVCFVDTKAFRRGQKREEGDLVDTCRTQNDLFTYGFSQRRKKSPRSPRRIRLSSNQNGLQPWHVFSCEIVHPQYPLDKPTAQKKQSLQVNKDL